MMMIEIACRMNPNTFRVEYFNKATGKQLAYRALEDTYSYRVGRTKALPLAGSQIKAGCSFLSGNSKMETTSSGTLS